MTATETFPSAPNPRDVPPRYEEPELLTHSPESEANYTDMRRLIEDGVNTPDDLVRAWGVQDWLEQTGNGTAEQNDAIADVANPTRHQLSRQGENAARWIAGGMKGRMPKGEEARRMAAEAQAEIDGRDSEVPRESAMRKVQGNFANRVNRSLLAHGVEYGSEQYEDHKAVPAESASRDEGGNRNPVRRFYTNGGTSPDGQPSRRSRRAAESAARRAAPETAEADGQTPASAGRPEPITDEQARLDPITRPHRLPDATAEMSEFLDGVLKYPDAAPAAEASEAVAGAAPAAETRQVGRHRTGDEQEASAPTGRHRRDKENDQQVSVRELINRIKQETAAAGEQTQDAGEQAEGTSEQSQDAEAVRRTRAAGVLGALATRREGMVRAAKEYAGVFKDLGARSAVESGLRDAKRWMDTKLLSGYGRLGDAGPRHAEPLDPAAEKSRRRMLKAAVVGAGIAAVGSVVGKYTGHDVFSGIDHLLGQSPSDQAGSLAPVVPAPSAPPALPHSLLHPPASFGLDKPGGSVMGAVYEQYDIDPSHLTGAQNRFANDLSDYALQHDLKGKSPTQLPLGQRFTIPQEVVDQARRNSGL